MRRILIIVRDGAQVRAELRRLHERPDAYHASLTERSIIVYPPNSEAEEYIVVTPYTSLRGQARFDEVVIDSVMLPGNTWRSSEQFREWIVNDVGHRLVSEESVVRWR